METGHLLRVHLRVVDLSNWSFLGKNSILNWPKCGNSFSRHGG